MRVKTPATALLLATAALAAGCATYRAEPLPDAAAVAEAPGPDMTRIAVAAASLDHPLLRPVQLDLSDGLSPDEAAVLAVLADPDLVTVRDAHGEAAAQLVGAGLLPNLDLSAEVDRPRGAGSEGTVNAFTVGLGVDVGRLVGRAARVAAASASLRSVDLEIAWREWQVAQEARLATVRLGMLGRRREILDREVAVRAATVAALEDAVAEGDATMDALALERAALETLRQGRGELDREVARTHSELCRLLGLPPTAHIEPALPVSPPLEALPPVTDLVRKAVKQRLDLRALELGHRAEEARVQAAVAAQFPSLSIGIAAQRNEAALRFLGGFVTLGLPFFDRNQGGIAEARAARTRLRDEYRARIASIRAEVARIAAEDDVLADRLGNARRGIASLAPMEAAERSAMADGDVDRLAWQQVRSELVDLRLQEAALLQARMELRVALAAALGGAPGAGGETP